MANYPTSRLLPAVLVLCFTCSLTPAFAATPGIWDGTADFGAFELTVTPDGMAISRIAYSFSDWSCGQSTMNGGITVTAGTPWPIVGNTFTLTTGLGGDSEMTVAGTFNTAVQASGTWNAVVNSTPCNGSWQAINGDAEVDINPEIDHAFTQGVYWNPVEYPGWGFLVDVQENRFFCAIFGYLDGEPTFITLQGERMSDDPQVYTGDAWRTSGNGFNSVDVGDFTWSVGTDSAVPAALLTLTSNILNVTGLELFRFAYAEIDEVDVLTGGDWNIIRREGDDTFGDLYSIDDMRLVDDGITYARVVDKADTSKVGAVGYFPDPETDFYAMLIEFDGQTDVFYVFLANSTDMFGVFWLVPTGSEPMGEGEYFRGASASLQAQDVQMPLAGMLQSAGQSQLHEKALAGQQLRDEASRLRFMFESLSARRAALD